MPNWKKVITSGSDASLSSLTTSGNISGSSTSTGSFGTLVAYRGITGHASANIGGTVDTLYLPTGFYSIGQSYHDGVLNIGGQIRSTNASNYFTGKVGIGTTSPISPLTVDGADGVYVRHTANPSIQFDDTNVADGSSPITYIDGDAGALLFGRANRNNSTGKRTASATMQSFDTSGNATFAGNVILNSDSTSFRAGASNDITMYHNGSHSYIENSTGELRLYQTSGDTLSFFTKPSGGSPTRRFTIGGDGNSTFTGDILLTSGTDYKPQLVIENTNANDRSPYLVFKKNSASPANNDGVGLIEFYGRDNTSSSRLMASIEASSPNVTDYDGKITFSTAIGGTMAARMLIDETGYVNFNHHSKIINGQMHHGLLSAGQLRRLIGFSTNNLCRINDEGEATLIGADGYTVTIGGDFAVDEDATFGGDVIVQGDITAQNYIVSSSVTYMTQSFSSGSTIFGDSVDDVHQFTGSLRVTGSGNHYIQTGNVGIGDTSPSEARLSIQNDTSGDYGLKVNQRTSTLGVLITHDDGWSNPNAGLLKVYSNSSATGTRNQVEIVQDHTSATGTTGLKIQQDSTGIGLSLDQNGDGKSIYIDSEATTSDIITVDTPTTTTGRVLNISDANSLTTGELIKAHSGAAGTQTRNLIQIVNDHASATGTTALYIQQDSTGPAIVTKGSGYAISGSSTSTGSFGHLMVGGGNFTSASLASSGGGGGGGGISLANGVDNRVITATGAGSANAEANLTFDGSTLATTGTITATGNVSGSSTSTGSFGHGYFGGDVQIDNSNNGHILLGDHASYRANIDYASTGNTIFSLANTYNNTGAKFEIRMGGNATGNAKLTILNGGNVGIGTASPDHTLHVKSSDISTLKLQRDSTTSGHSAYLSFGISTNDTITQASIIAYRIDADEADLAFNTGANAGTEAMRILSTGKVGIGTTSPAHLLHVAGDIRADGDIIAQNYIVSSSVTYMTQSFSSGSTIFGDTIDDTHQFTGSLNISGSGAQLTIDEGTAQFTIRKYQSYTDIHSGGHMFIQRTGGKKLRLDTNYIGVEDSLNVTGDGHITASGNIVAAGNISGSSTSTGSFGALYTSGNVGIGTTSPATELHVNGSGEIITRLQSGNKYFDMSVNASGNAAFQNGSGGDITFWDDQIGIMILHDAKVGMGGILDPQETLHISGSGTTKLFVEGDISGSSTSTGSFGALTIDGSPLISGGSDGIAIGMPAPGNIEFTVKSTSNEATIRLSDNDTTAYFNSLDNYLSIGRDTGLSARALNVSLALDPVRVGIGTTSPTQMLEIAGDVRIKDARSLFFKRHGDNYAWRIRNESAADGSTYGFNGSNDLIFEVVGSSHTNADPSDSSHSLYASSANTLVLQEAGQVGIKVADPQYTLDVGGAINASGNITVGGTVDGIDIAARDAILTSTTTTAGAALPKAGGTMSGNIVMADDTSIGISDSAERIEFDGAGDISVLGANLGVGVSDPDEILETKISGTNKSSFVGTNANDDRVRLINYDRTNSGTLLGISKDGMNGLSLQPNDKGVILTYTNTPLYFGTNNTLALTLDTSQNATFTGDVKVSRLKVNDKFAFEDVSNVLWLAEGFGSVLVKKDTTFAGTIGSGAITSTAGIAGTTGTFSGDVTINGGDITLVNATPTIVAEQSAGAIRAKIKFPTSSGDGDITFETTTNGAGAITEQMRITHAGNIGIGTTSPAHLLHVAGDIRADGDIIAQNYIVSSSVTYMTQSFSSGSTVFGDTITDTHKFTGSLSVTGSSTFAGSVLPVGDNTRTLGASGAMWDMIWTNQIYSTGGSLIYQNNTQFDGDIRVLHSNTDSAAIWLDNTSTNGDAWRLASNGAAASPGVGAFSIYNSDTDLYGLTILNTGNVGIGTTSPAQPLHIVGSNNGGLEIETTSGAPTIIFDMPSNESSRLYFQEAGTLLGSIYYDSAGVNDNLVFSVAGVGGNNVERLRITGDNKISGSAISTGSFGVLQLSKYNQGIGDAGSTIFGGDAAKPGMTGTENTVFGSNALTDITSGAGNTALGREAAMNVSTGGDNVAIGKLSLATATSPVNNVAIGNEALRLTNTGGSNVGVGRESGYSGTTHSGSVYIGEQAGYSVTTGNQNIAIGHNAINGGTTTGDNNIAIGASAGDALTSGYNNVLMGPNAGGAITTGYNNIAIGHLTGDAITDGIHNILVGTNGCGGSIIGGDKNVAMGGSALEQITTGDGNIAIGYNSGQGNTGADYNTTVGYGAGDLTGAGNTAIGKGTLSGNGAGTYNVGLGYEAGNDISTGDYNVAVGAYALDAEDTGNKNTAVGYNALTALNYNGDGYSVAVGYHAGSSATTGIENTFVGANSGINVTTGDFNIMLGVAAGANGGDVDKTIFIGTQAGAGQTMTADADGTVAIGHYAGHNIKTGQYNTAIGYEALYTATELDKNTAIGYQALKVASGSAGTGDNTAVGYLAGTSITTGAGNTLMGALAGQQLTTGAQSIFIGTAAGYTTTATSTNIAIGNQAMGSGDVTSAGTIAIGNQTLRYLTSGANNVAVGFQSQKYNTTGDYNTTFGYEAFRGVSGGELDKNTAIGYRALYVASGSAGTGENTAVGYLAGTAITTGTQNTIMGASAGDGINTGFQNTTIGYAAGGALTSGAYNTAIGTNALSNQGGSSGATAVGYYCLGSANGANNTGLGAQAMYNMNSGGNNTALGYRAGRYYGSGTDGLTTANQCIYIGELSRGNANSMTNEIVIGYNAEGRGGSNSVTIGNSSVTLWLPGADNVASLGSASYRFSNLYVADVQMSNEGTEGNEVDGTTGNWTIQEGEDDLYLLNRKNGKKYRFKLEEIK